jgi:hypothetical protein
MRDQCISHLSLEQDEVITRLRAESLAANLRYLYAFSGLIIVSFISQLVYFLASVTQGPGTPALPYTPHHSLLSMLLHVYLLFLAEARFHAKLEPLKLFSPPPQLLSLPSRWVFHGLAVISPICTLVLAKPWETVIWWSIAAILGSAVEAMGNSIDDELRSIENLEGKRYTAPGA